MNKRLKKLLSLLMALVMIISMAPPAFALREITLPGDGWDRDIGEDDVRDFNPGVEPEDKEEYDYFSAFDEESGINVTVEAPMGSLPTLAEVRVQSVDPESVRDAVDEALGNEANILVAMDISFWLEDIEIEPEEPVRVRIAAPELEGRSDLTVVHIPDEEEPETVDLIPEEDLTFALGTNEVAFTSGDFSVYAVIGGSANDLKLTVEFYESATATTPLSTQVLVLEQFDEEGEKPLIDPGVPTITATQSFEGWRIDAEHEKLDINGLNAYIHETYGSMTADATLRVNAMIFNVRYVIYHDQSGAVLRTQSFHVEEGGTASVTISHPYVPFKDGQNFKAWTLEADVEVAGDYPLYKDTATDEGHLYQDGTAYSLSDTIDLYPYLQNGCWLVFDNYIDQDADTTSASFTSPVFVAEGVNTAAPTTPTRTGYTFGGWYTSKSFATKFVFGSTIAEETTVYAKWIPKETTYRVTFWQQMNTDPVDAADADKTYSHYTPTAVTVVRTAHTGNQVSITEADTRLGNRNDSTTDYGEMGFYFVYNANNSDTEPVTVKGDGSTVLNVYYDRKPITISFYTASNKNTLATLAKYEEAENGGYYYYPYTSGYYLIGTGPNADAQYSYGTTVYYHDSYTSSNLPSYDNVTKYYSSGMSNHTLNSSNTYQSWNANENTLIYQYTSWGTTYYRPLYYQFTSQGAGYYAVGTGPDPTAAGTHNLTSIPNPMTGLYGAPLPNWPDEPEGQEWAYDDAEDGKHYGITVRDSFNIPDNKYTTTWDIYGETPNWTSYKMIHWMIQDLNGNYEEKAATKLGNGVTQYYDDGKFMGFKAKGHNLTTNSTTSGFVAFSGSEVGIGYSDAGNDAYIYFDRRSNALEFVSMNQSVRTEQVPYEKSLSEYSDTVPENGEAGYYFDGWYADPGFDTEFDFSQEMPNYQVTVYAKWTLTRYRVVLDPTGGQSGVNPSDITFPGNQATTFRVDYGEQVQASSINNATRQGYTLLGWYLDPQFTQPFSFAQPVTDAVADMNYINASDAERQGSDPWNIDDETGQPKTYTDVGRDNVRGKVTIYAHWREDPDGIIGVNIRYDAVESSEHEGYFGTDQTNTTWDDPDIYADQAQAYAQPASTPKEYDPALKFLYWDILDKNGQSSGRKAYPGQTWEVHFADAVEEPINNGNAVEEPELLTFDRGNLNIIRPGQAGVMAQTITAYEPVNTIETGVEYLIGYKDGDTVYLLMNFNPNTNSSYTSASIGNTSNVWISYAIPAITDANGYVIGVDNSTITNATFEHVGWKFVANGTNNYIIQNASNSSYHLGLYGTGSSYPDLYSKTNNSYYNQWRWTNSRLSYYASSSTSHYVTLIGSSEGDAHYFYAPTSANATYSTLQLYKKTEIASGHTVKFMDGFTNTQIGADQIVDDGAAAEAPEAPDHTDQQMIFTGWDTDFSYVTSDLIVTAQYMSVTDLEYTVTFRYMDGNGQWQSVSQTVQHGQSATPPTLPDPPAGYTFNSWDKRYESITANITINAVYKQVATTKYVVTLRAVYGRADAGSVTHINWYSNKYDAYGNEIPDVATATTYVPAATLFPNGIAEKSGSEATFAYEGGNTPTYGDHGYNLIYDTVEIPESVRIPEKPYAIPGYRFLGWARIADANSIPEGASASDYVTDPSQITPDDVYIRWVEDNSETGAGHYEAQGSNRLSKDYYLIGWINNADYRGEDYHFNSNGTYTVTFPTDTYVFVKNGDGAWFMTDGYGDGTSGTNLYAAVGELRPKEDGGRGDKIFVPANTEVTFTLIEQGDTLFLSYVEGAPTSNEGEETWVPVTYVAANEQKPYHDMYAVWVGEFYIYHSGIEGGALEKVTIDFKGGYDLTARVTALSQSRDGEADKFLYGGYYLDGGFTAPAVDDKGVPTATCAAYDGANWTWTTPVTDQPGNAITPKGGVTYYIKEVPADKYLQPYFHYTYLKESDPAYQTIRTAWLISDIDDAMYKETGFMIINDNDKANVCTQLTVQNTVGGASVVLKPTTIFRSKGVTKGFLSYLEVLSNGEQTLLKEGNTVVQYWVTPDGLIVTGISARTFNALDTRKNIKAEGGVVTETVRSTIGVFSAPAAEPEP
jgi:uncharacterized repeat protein (TIGR02543 family)